MAATLSRKDMPPPSNVFPLDPNHPLIPIDVLLEGPKGRQFVRMALDTGATYTMAPVSTLLAIGYDPATSDRRVEFIAVGSVEYRPVIRLHAIEALGISLKGIEIVCHDLPPQSPVRGLLGLNVLKHLSVHLDFPERLLRVTNNPSQKYPVSGPVAKWPNNRFWDRL